MMENPRILVDARVGWGSGIGRYVANLLPLVARRLPGAELVVLVLQRDVERAAQALGGAAGITLRPCTISPFSLAEQVRLPHLASGFDLAWFTNYWVPLRWKGPFVVTVHDMLHQETRLFPASRARRLLSRRTFAHVAAHAKAVMFDSRFTRREFERQLGPARSGGVVHLGVDHHGWSADRPVVGPSSRERRLLVVASAKQHKNFGVLLDAWTRARPDDGWTLTIVTPDQELRSSIDLAALSAGAGRVEVIQGLDDEALASLYRSSALVATPSLYEGFGLPLLEGLMAGALCISSTAESLVEIAGGAWVVFVNGRDVDGWAQAIERGCSLIDDASADLGALIEANRHHAAAFTWDRAANLTADILLEALANISQAPTKQTP
ncbi:glycosyltransferase family 4 protein [Sphingomonas bacterium]|uniref:glycosyltransferase family 4 protein n=1 Tax=Sphingomonas bacterium TaxID=1895847 RepID=UPI0015752640|nr:glycosyltransferase family 1 protein [Sphingomonas bacterium]